MKNNLFKTVLVPDWDNVPVGTKFKAKIEGVECEGRIQKEDGDVYLYPDIYLCQNKKDGVKCYDQLGFDHSWYIKDGSLKQLEENNVEIISLELDPSFEAPSIIKVGDYRVTFKKGKIHVGCETIFNEQIMEVVKHLIW